MTPPDVLALNLNSTLRKTTLSQTLEAMLAQTANDSLWRRVLQDYGALFAAASYVLVPPVPVFTSEAAVQDFQARAGWLTVDFDGVKIELQPAAMRNLLDARTEANAENLSITPRGGSEAARRSYADTLRLWESRFQPALIHWCACERLEFDEAERLRTLSPDAQIAAVMELEKQGLYFSKDLSKSVFYSVAPPGTSQHLSMLAFDVTEFRDPRVRQILARHGWFQTVRSDLPHFTFLGLEESSLPERGLKCVEVDGQTFWIPDDVG